MTMATLTVGSGGTYATITAAMQAANPGDIIAFESGYTAETAVVTVSGLTFTGDTSNTGIALTLGAGIASVALQGTAQLAVNGNATDNTINAGLGNDSNVDGGDGTDLLILDYSSLGAVYHLGSYFTVGGIDDVDYSYIERFDITGSATQSNNLHGDNLDDRLIGGGADDILDTSAGSIAGSTEVVDGGAGNDLWKADLGAATTDIIFSAQDSQAGFVTLSTGLQVARIERVELTTGSGNDRISVAGFTGASRITTGSGNDTINAGLGNDSNVDGGDGTDLLILDYSSLGAVYHLGSYFTVGGIDDVDYSYIERFDITGSATQSNNLHGDNLDDRLIGGAVADTLTGFDGNDLIEGGAGADTIDGGGASSLHGDVASYEHSSAGVQVDLNDLGVAQVSTGDADGDVLLGIESVIGSSHADILIGSSVSNYFFGGAGADYMQGGDGDNDYFEFATGDAPAGETIDGGAGDHDNIVTASATLDLSQATITGIEGIFLTNQTGTALTVGSKAFALIVDADWGADDSVTYLGGSFTAPELEQLFVQGVETVFDASGSHAVDRAPVFADLDGTRSAVPQVRTLLDSDVTVADAELDVDGDYTGTSLAIERTTGADTDDYFDLFTDGASFTITADVVLRFNGLIFARITAGLGSFGVDFTSEETTATKALVNDVLQHVFYENLSASPPTAVTLRYAFNDGNAGAQGWGGEMTGYAFATVDLTANAAPVLDLDASGDGTGYETTFTEDGAAVAVVDTDVAIADTDADMVSATITLTNAQTGDSLAVSDTDALALLGISVDGASTATTIILTGTATRAEYQAALELIVFGNTSDAPDTTDRVVEVVVNDGVDTSNTATATIHVAAVDDTPTVDVPATTVAATEQGAAAVGAGAAVGDADDTSLEGATVSITGGFQAGEDVLAFADQNGITGSYNATTGVLTLTGTASDAAYQAALRAVAYTNTSDTPDTGNRTIGFTVADGTGSSTVATRTVTVAAVNDAPAVVAPASVNATVNIAQAVTGISFSDVDASAGAVTVTLHVDSGTIAFATAAGVTIGGSGTTTVTLGGSIASINAAIAAAKLKFTSAASAADANLTVTVDDNGNTGGGDLTASATVHLLVADVQTGTAAANTLIGSAKASTLKGLGGADTLKGNGGSDKLFGGTGHDKLTGGSSGDWFIFDSPPTGANWDHVTDFQHGQDKIVLDRTGVLFSKLPANGSLDSPVKLKAGILKIGLKATDKNDFLVYDQAHGKLYYDANANGAGGMNLIAALDKVSGHFPTLSMGDILLI